MYPFHLIPLAIIWQSLPNLATALWPLPSCSPGCSTVTKIWRYPLPHPLPLFCPYIAIWRDHLSAICQSQYSSFHLILDKLIHATPQQSTLSSLPLRPTHIPLHNSQPSLLSHSVPLLFHSTTVDPLFSPIQSHSYLSTQKSPLSSLSLRRTHIPLHNSRPSLHSHSVPLLPSTERSISLFSPTPSHSYTLHNNQPSLHSHSVPLLPSSQRSIPLFSPTPSHSYPLFCHTQQCFPLSYSTSVLLFTLL
jgi:hypothetical protein